MRHSDASVGAEARDDGTVVEAVGIGPGDPAYLSERARQSIRGADVVVGFETVVGHVSEHVTGTTIACGYDDEAAALSQFADRVADGARGTAVLMGDPNVSGYAFVEKVERAVDPPVRIVPGVSSIQVAASRARTALEDSTFVTLHRRGDLDADLDRLADAAGDRHLLVLPRPYDCMPGEVAAHLVDRGVDPGLEANVFEHLTLPDESADRLPLGELADRAGGGRRGDGPYSDLSVMVVRRADP